MNSRPITDATRRTRRGPAGSRSIRASSSPWIVSGISTSAISAVATQRPSRKTSSAAVDEHPQGLLDEERVAVGTGDDPFADGIGQLVDLEQVRDEGPRVLVREGRERDHVELRRTRAASPRPASSPGPRDLRAWTRSAAAARRPPRAGGPRGTRPRRRPTSGGPRAPRPPGPAAAQARTRRRSR